ncbi:F0F1 ATP synthase subunit B family protein [Myxosarcina sp. GI1(2024)]
MLIDWFTVIAQVINFLILVFLLHRFLYRPITKTIQARQKEIQRRWQEAEEEKKAAEAEAAHYERQQQELEQQRQAIIEESKEQGEREYHDLLERARQEVEQKQAAWSEAIARQQEQFFEDLQQKVTQQVYQISRRAFQDLADRSLERQAIATFINRLSNLDEQSRETLAQSVEKSESGLLIRSSFELPEESCQQIVDSLNRQQIYQDNNLRFTTTKDLICGIELQASDYKIAWNLQDYLQSLEHHLESHFSQNGRESKNRNEDKEEKRN